MTMLLPVVSSGSDTNMSGTVGKIGSLLASRLSNVQEGSVKIIKIDVQGSRVGDRSWYVVRVVKDG